MAIVLLFLLVGTLAYLGWRWRTTTLTRACRWRQNRAEGTWRCVSCGAECRGKAEPRDCLKRERGIS